MLIIPAIDIMGGKVVRLQRGEFEKVKAYDLSPLEYAKKWQEEGASGIHIVDLDGAKTGEPVNFETIAEIIKTIPIPIEVGGGIRTTDEVKRYLDAGAGRVVLSTKVLEDISFLKRPELKESLSRIAVSIDIKQIQTSEIITGATSGWRRGGDMLIDIPEFIGVVSSEGVTYINFSDISRDGMLSGPDTAKIVHFLQLAKKSSAVKLFFTYAGGISSLYDIKALATLKEDKVDAVIVGKALYENKFSLKEAIAKAADAN